MEGLRRRRGERGRAGKGSLSGRSEDPRGKLTGERKGWRVKKEGISKRGEEVAGESGRGRERAGEKSPQKRERKGGPSTEGG